MRGKAVTAGDRRVNQARIAEKLGASRRVRVGEPEGPVEMLTYAARVREAVGTFVGKVEAAHRRTANSRQVF